MSIAGNPPGEGGRLQPQMYDLLTEATGHVASFLERALPSLGDDWWNRHVNPFLNPTQARHLPRKSLQSLDLAALLRVLDASWPALAGWVGHEGPEPRHYIKEMQTVRNRWAHLSPAGLPADDVYRDLDTLQRFLRVVGADPALVGRVASVKRVLVASESPPTTPAVRPLGEIGVGQIVSLRSDATARGVVTAVRPGQPEGRYDVFINNAVQVFYASQLQPLQAVPPEPEPVPLQEFHARLSALQIRHPGVSVLYSLNAARVDYIPYQFRPVLKFIKADLPRLLIADGVGVGKTIEAGLILRELQARRDVRSVLVICPRPLVTEHKWRLELRRFDERFSHLDGDLLRHCLSETDLDGEWPAQYAKCIVPYSLFDEQLLHGSTRKGERRTKGLLDLDPPPHFDLVIVDEAHHIRNTNTYTHQAVRYFCENAEAVVFLTATPIQMGSDDLFVLLNVLRPDLVLDRESYEHMAEPNPHINSAIAAMRAAQGSWQSGARTALRQAAATSWGQAILSHDPEFQRVDALLGGRDLTPAERVDMISALERMHTFAGIISRTRRRDIGDFTVRCPETVTVDFTPAQQRLHDDLLDVQADIYEALHGDMNVKFMLTTLRRQAASCLYGLAPMVQDILMRRLDELSWDETGESGGLPSGAAVRALENRILDVLSQAEHLDPHDPKLDALVRVLTDKQRLENNKVMLFSTFRHTLYYLERGLLERGFRVGLVHGDTEDADRVKLRERFRLERRNPEALDVLLFSEVGCEGLDYQFCDCIVNYDLPWNPMRVEQRIGRIDRNGQRSPKVLIYNLITPGTVDADIYERCLVRIGVFNSALGASEEILGEITREIRDIAEDITLSEQERQQKLQQLADNQIRLMREEQALEEQQVELFGLRPPPQPGRAEVEEATSYWLSAESIQNLVRQYLQQRCGPDGQYILGERPLKTLRLSQEGRSRLLSDYERLPRQTSPLAREWEQWLKGGSPLLSCTFEAQCAKDNPQAHFVMPLHPLARQAAEALVPQGDLMAAVDVSANGMPPGTYPFAIYEWRFSGVREDLSLCPVCSGGLSSDQLLPLLERARPVSDGPTQLRVEDRDALDIQHYELWTEARREHQERTRQLARYRRESLDTSHRARLALLQRQLAQTGDERLRRMRRSQIAAAEADYVRRAQELEIAGERAELTARPVAFGVITVGRGLSG